MATYDVDVRRLGVMIVDHEARRRRSMDGAVRASVKTAVRIIRANAPKASGALSKSVEPEGNEVVVRAPHAQAVEVGQRPHMPPVGPLIEWARRVGAEDPRDLAWATAKKIAREGVKPTWFVRSSIPKIMEATGVQVRYVLKE